MDGQGYALITGASSGIGECFARALARRKRNLVLVARSTQKLEALARELQSSYGILAEPLDFDLSRVGAAADLVKRLGERGLKINLLVNNAGFGARGRSWELAPERLGQMIRLNVEALVELTHLLLPAMVEARSGAVVNVSSTASFQAVPFTSVYAATKAFVTSFSMGLEEELDPFGVRVVTLCPGGTETNFFRAGEYGMRRVPGGLQAPEEVVELGLKALDRGGGLVVPRIFNKFSIFVQRFVPRTWPVKAAGRLFQV